MIQAQMVVLGVEIPEVLEEQVTELWEKSMTRVLRRDWHKKSYPDRFKAGKQAKFQQRRRSKAYENRKRRLKGHRRNLVWSGETERQSTRRITIKRGSASRSAATGARGEVSQGGRGEFTLTVSLKVPKHMTYAPRKRERQELVEMPDWEREWVNKLAGQELARRVKREVRKYEKTRTVLYGYGAGEGAA